MCVVREKSNVPQLITKVSILRKLSITVEKSCQEEKGGNKWRLSEEDSQLPKTASIISASSSLDAILNANRIAVTGMDPVAV